MKNFLSACFAVAAGLFSITHAAAAADYPSKPVSIIVGFPAGQMIDLLSRVVAQGLSEETGSNFIVENRPGQGGSIALGQLKNEKPDGYAMAVAATAALAVNPHLYGETLKYDPSTDFRYAAMLGQIPFVLVTHAGSPFHSLQDVVKYARENPGKLSYSSPGNGTLPHLGMLRLQKKLGIDLLHVPYKGSPQAVQDLAAGRIDIAFDTQALTQPLAEAGKLRMLAVTGAERLESLPGIPTMMESGAVDFTLTAWFTLALPKGAPDDVVNTLGRAIKNLMQQDKTLEAVKKTGATPLIMTPQEAEALVARDFGTWGVLVKEAAATVD
ncbi:MAG: tripartite tricarboxylate transporter substrate binding protein [Candidimonas sp.]